MIRFGLNFLGLLLVVIVNALANTLPLNGQTTGEISNRLNVLFTPAGYVFSIWGLIYLLLFIWVLRQLPKNRRNLPLYQSTSGLFLLTCMLNILWIFLWHYEYFFYTVLVMIAFLITLIFLYKKVKSFHPPKIDVIPISIYLGWVSVALIANISYYLVYIQWNGWGISPVVWTIIMLWVAALLAGIFYMKEKDPYYVLVFIWALIGIGVKNQATFPSVSYVSYVLSIALLIFLWVNKGKSST
ncbi:benzodiazapine receptor [Bacillus sp. SLBN-46]|uniref:TspO/MBR family protein n=1 Tax=Bacillus sp. SLBN-46 TaxID=3042283 RepID=UPI00285487EE|nr:TspO/MBR family protein [Bacillus sp. SLBN-46]MDR6124113.1 benzodiazapine receptor [Bacillus sp. SLBN-46]